MDSFTIETIIKGEKSNILVLPGEYCGHSIFYLITGGKEISEIIYTDSHQWEIIDGYRLEKEDLAVITANIEAHYLG